MGICYDHEGCQRACMSGCVEGQRIAMHRLSG